MLALLPVYKGGQIVAWATIDSEDYEHLCKHRWRLDFHGYVRRPSGTRGRSIALHRDVLGLVRGDGKVADHINGDTLDNRRANLRVGTHALNAQNRRKQTGRSSRYVGVTWHRKCQKWQAMATLQGRVHYLGLFEDEHAAGEASAQFRAQNMPFSPEALVL